MMKSKKLISAILAAASIAGGVVGAQAQTIEGLENKVDTYTSRVQQAEPKFKTFRQKLMLLIRRVSPITKLGLKQIKKPLINRARIFLNSRRMQTNSTGRSIHWRRKPASILL